MVGFYRLGTTKFKKYIFIAFDTGFYIYIVLYEKADKISRPKYSGPKIAYLSNLAPIENQGLQIYLEPSWHS